MDRSGSGLGLQAEDGLGQGKLGAGVEAGLA